MVITGLPSCSGADVLFINTDKLTSAGLPIDPAHLPTTWDQLLAIAQTVSSHNYSSTWGNTAY